MAISFTSGELTKRLVVHGENQVIDHHYITLGLYWRHLSTGLSYTLTHGVDLTNISDGTLSDLLAQMYRCVQYDTKITWFPYQMVFLSFNSNTKAVQQELLILPENLSSLQAQFFGERGVHVALSLLFCVVFCRSLFVLLFYFFRLLYYLSFSDLQFLIDGGSPLVSSNFSSG